MNKVAIFIIASISMLLGLISCTDNHSYQESSVKVGTSLNLTAYLESGYETKTGLVDNGSGGKSVVWRSGDAISLFFNSGSGGGDKFTTTSTGSKATFRGSISAISGDLSETGGEAWFWATYPYNTTASCDGNTITTRLPIAQIAYPNDVADNLLVTVGRSENLSIYFKNTCAVIGISVCTEGITKITFEGNGDEAVSGWFVASFDGNGNVVTSPSENSSKYVEITPAGGSTFETGTRYYFAILSGTFSSGYKLTFERNDGTAATFTRNTSFTFDRKFYTMTNKDDGLTFSPFTPDPTRWITFKDAAVKAICVENWDTNGDGELSYEEAAAVTTISTLFCENEAITSFDEFQFFTGVSSIKNWAFKSCSSLSSITIPENVTTIESAAFFNCSSLTEIVMPDHVISLGLQAFRGCSNLTTVVFSSDLESIGQQAFWGCSSLTDFVLPNGLTSIESSAFYSCKSLINIVIPNTVTSIGGGAFYSCKKLSNITLSNSLTSIVQLFADCPSLTHIEIPISVKTIEGYAFSGTVLTNIVLPEGLISLGESAFDSSTRLTSIQVNAVIPPAGGSNMFNNTGNCPIYVPAASVNTYKTAEYWSDYAERIQAIPGSAIEVTGVSLNSSTLSLTVGSSETLTATVSPDNATNKTVSWSTSDSGVASVSDGLVTAVGVGTATITVTTEDGGKTATCAVTVNPVEVTSVTLDQNTLSLTKGSTATLVATVNPATATDKTVTWSSNDTDVATVDANGKVTAVGGGSATITATAGGKSATCDVTVTVPVTGVSLSQTTLTLSMNATETLIATVNPSDALNKNVTWSSSNTAVATVVNGSVTAVGVGTATITVTTEDGSKTATCAVTVNPIEVTSVTLDQNTLSLTKGGTATLVATVNPATATDKTVTWSSNDTDVATVDANGKVTAVGGGSATITATAGGKTATCDVTVTVPVTGVSLNKTTLTLSMNAAETLTATVNPSDASNKNVTWSSSNTAVATVANGVVTAVSSGTATITVTTVDGSKTATCSVTVNPVSGGNEGVIGGVVD